MVDYCNDYTNNMCKQQAWLTPKESLRYEKIRFPPLAMNINMTYIAVFQCKKSEDKITQNLTTLR